MTFDTRGKQFLGRAVLAAASLVGLLECAAPQGAFAYDGARCERRIAKADHRLHEAVEHHGWNSRQADHARHELREARERCWNERHRLWEEDHHRWRSDRDWDDHDRP